MKKIILILFTYFFSASVFSQTGIGTNTPNASAKLEVAATDKGFLPPRVVLTAANVFAPITGTAASAVGLLIYNSSTAGTAPNNVIPGYYYWNGASWIQIVGGLIIDNSKSASFALAATDTNKIFLITSSSAVTVTVQNNLPIGFSCQIIQAGSGMITLLGSSVALNSANGLSTRTTNSAIGLVMNTGTTGYVFGDTIY